MSQDEIVDIVDEKDEVLYQATKREAHEKGLLHRCVVSEIRDSQGNWVLVKPSLHKQDSNQYVSPVGGHVQAGETFEEALKREALEEVGVADFKFKYIGKLFYDRKVLGRHENHSFIVYQIDSDQDLVLNHEFAEYKKFTNDELKKELKEHPEIFGHPFIFLISNLYPEMLK